MITFDSDFMETLIEYDIEMTIESFTDRTHFIFEGKDQFSNRWQISELIEHERLKMFAETNANHILGDKVDRLIEDIKQVKVN
jgi:hypothetical protein